MYIDAPDELWYARIPEDREPTLIQITGFETYMNASLVFFRAERSEGRDSITVRVTPERPGSETDLSARLMPYLLGHLRDTIEGSYNARPAVWCPTAPLTAT